MADYTTHEGIGATATDSATNRSASKRTGLTVNPRVYPLVAIVNAHELTTRIEESLLSMGDPTIGADGAPDNLKPARRESIFGFLNDRVFPRGLQVHSATAKC
jgi:hypothetical protein